MVKTTNFLNDMFRALKWIRKKEIKTDGRVGNFFKRIKKEMKK